MIITATVIFASFYPAGRYVITITYRLESDPYCAGSFDYPATYHDEAAAHEAAATINFAAVVAAHIAAEAARVLNAARFAPNAKVVIS